MDQVTKKGKVIHSSDVLEISQQCPLFRLSPEVRQIILGNILKETKNITVCDSGKLRYGGISLYVVCKTMKEDMEALTRSWLPSSSVSLECAQSNLRYVPQVVEDFRKVAEASKRDWKRIQLRLIWFSDALVEQIKEENWSLNSPEWSLVVKENGEQWQAEINRHLPTGAEVNITGYAPPLTLHPISPAWNYINRVHIKAEWLLQHGSGVTEPAHVSKTMWTLNFVGDVWDGLHRHMNNIFGETSLHRDSVDSGEKMILARLANVPKEEVQSFVVGFHRALHLLE